MPEQHEDAGAGLQFLIADGLSFQRRIFVISLLLAFGLAVQLSVSLFAGWLFFFVGCLFAIVRGRRLEPALQYGGEWQTTTMEGFRTVAALQRRIESWGSRTGNFNPTQIKGCALLFLMGGAIALGTLFIFAGVDGGAHWTGVPFVMGGPLWPVWLLDTLTLLIPLWFSGLVSVWQPEELLLKVEQLLFIAREVEKQPNLELLPSLQMAPGDKGGVPTDARLLVKLKDAPEDFVGIQVQTSLNSVQGKKYPYTYCVILARPGFGLAARLEPHLGRPGVSSVFSALFRSSEAGKEADYARFEGRIVELTREKDMDVAVVRQQTAHGGYKTDRPQAYAAFQTALVLGRLATRGAPPDSESKP